MLAINPTDVPIDELERNRGVVLWRRSGIAPLPTAAPQLQISSDGISYVAHATMTPDPQGWTASGVPEFANYVRARAVLPANAGVLEVSLQPNLVFASGFDGP